MLISILSTKISRAFTFMIGWAHGGWYCTDHQHTEYENFAGFYDWLIFLRSSKVHSFFGNIGSPKSQHKES